MYQKQILYAAVVSIKYLFNIEHEISEQLLIVFLLSLVCIRQIVAEFAHNTRLQIEETGTFIKYAVACVKEQLHNNDNFNIPTSTV